MAAHDPQSGRLQAFKVVLPVQRRPSEPQQQSHEGYVWLYVLCGRLRVLLGDHDLTLTTGEVDTRTPHWYDNPGDVTSEVLALAGPQGERPQVRARPQRTADRSEASAMSSCTER